MFELLGVKKVRLLTNNPNKIDTMKKAGINVVERVPLNVGENRYNTEYLDTKAKKWDITLYITMKNTFWTVLIVNRKSRQNKQKNDRTLIMRSSYISLCSSSPNTLENARSPVAFPVFTMVCIAWVGG